VLRLVAAARGPEPVQLWIGDSHAAWLNGNDRLKPAASLGFVPRYLEAGCAVAVAAGAPLAAFVVPVPPSDGFGDKWGFPIRGTLAERRAAHAAIRAELADEVGRGGLALPVLLVDATPHLVDELGGLRDELSVDGCHLNGDGSRFVHGRLAELLDARRAAVC
jgi:lysophospholipase L1-like esterase